MSSRGASHGLMASAGFGIVRANPTPNREAPLLDVRPAGQERVVGLGVPYAALEGHAERNQRATEDLRLPVAPTDTLPSPGPSGL